MTPLVAAYRLQLREGLDFARAAELAPYLARLGVSHLYASPVFQAAPDSTHGYNLADFNRIEPALGGEAGFKAMVEAMRAHGLALILDFVPNHMAATPHNPWWCDILEWGARSPYAHYFDIDWSSPKLIIPALGDTYGNVLEKGELSLYFDAADGGLSMTYYELRIPLNPPSYAQVLTLPQEEAFTDLANRFAVASEETAPELKAELATLVANGDAHAAMRRAVADAVADKERLHLLHEAQVWRLAYWRAARERLTYRRFFEIADLVGVRMEQPSVFDDAHRLVLKLAEEGRIEGLRLDHIDGLAEPKTYLRRLREALGNDDFYVVVEKILGLNERLPAAWPVQGTTGYEFIGALAGLFTDPDGEVPLTEVYEAFVGEQIDYGETVVQTKRRILTRNLAGELDVLTQLASDLAAGELATRDFGADTLRRAIIEMAVTLPVYRTYVDVEGPSDDDRARIEACAVQAKTTREVEDEAAVDFIARLVLLDMPDPERRGQALVFATRFQQTTGPLMAKAVEDTLFYRYNRLVALNEVGGGPEMFGAPVDAFHQAMAERRAHQPLGLLATSTHDTKRGEDARARLYALSEAPQAWADAVARWSELNAGLCGEHEGAPAPTRNDEWMFYQALLGVWPAGLAPDDASGLATLADRMVGYMHKAAREAKVLTSWTAPAPDYEAALEGFVRAAMDSARSTAFLRDFASTARPFIVAGAVTSLAQTLIKLTAPGVPDIYQGSEVWELSLVDPDNRRTVDFAARAEALDGIGDPLSCLEGWLDGRVKLALTAALLTERRRRPELFTSGDYIALKIEGERGEDAIAYARRHGEAACVALVPRRPLKLLRGSASPRIPPDAWSSTALVLPDDLAERDWRDPLTGRIVTKAPRGRLPLASLLSGLPVAILTG